MGLISDCFTVDTKSGRQPCCSRSQPNRYDFSSPHDQEWTGCGGDAARSTCSRNADKWGNSAQSRQINSVRFPAIANQSSPEQLQVPDSILEAETLLNQKFDLAMHWGPSCSLTRAERLERGRRLGLASQKWNWVSTVLDKYPELAKLKSDQRIQVLQQQHVPMLAADQTVVLVSAQTDPAVKACLSTHSLTASKSKGAKNSALIEESKQVPDPSERSQLEGRRLGGHSSMAKKERFMSSAQRRVSIYLQTSINLSICRYKILVLTDGASHSLLNTSVNNPPTRKKSSPMARVRPPWILDCRSRRLRVMC